MKTCTKCKIEKPLNEFWKSCKSKDGLRCHCKECVRDNRRTDINKEKDYNRLKEWRKNNPEKYQEQYIRLYNNNTERCLLNSKKWRENNPEQYKKSVNNWRENNPEKIKETRNKRHNERIKEDSLYKCNLLIRGVITQSFKRQGYTKKSRAYEILGCSFEEFKQYLESQFQSWMTWENQGKYNGQFNYGWDIDHIIPISSATTEEEVIRLNHYSNLQPLCSKINRDIKKDKLEYEIIQ